MELSDEELSNAAGGIDARELGRKLANGIWDDVTGDWMNP